MNSQIQDILTILLIFMIVILFLLVVVFIALKVREKKADKSDIKKDKKKDIKEGKKKTEEKGSNEYSKKSVFSFMDFEKIEDNMIIQKEKKKYLMVVECQGINYDLMSGVEKTSVEQGFIQFLNTLRHPIQIYIQTRTVNLAGSINNYKNKLKTIKDNYIKAEMDYTSKINSDRFSDEQKKKIEIEYIKRRNLYEYGLDIIKNTEQMSFNRNILTKKYYIVIPYYPEEIENKDYSEEEIRSIAFSELYTKSQSIISSLHVCGIKGKVMDSIELTELLYVAYNRDDSEIYDLNSVISGGYEELYSTSQDVLEKRSRELNKKIKEDAERKANETVMKVIEESEKEKEVREKEEQLEKMINKMAKMFISENEQYIGVDVAEKAKQKIDEESKEKEEKVDDKEKTKKASTTRGRKKIQ